MKDSPGFRIAVFASGTGSNFRAIHTAVSRGEIPSASIAGLITNNPDAGARRYAGENDIPAVVINKTLHPGDGGVTNAILETLKSWSPDLVALAGYMKKLERPVVEAYRNRMLNIHPALLPSFGGRGMYGMHVHEAALEYGVQFSGVTVHIVDFDYDTGPIVLQDVVPVCQDDTPEILQKRVLKREHTLYPEAIKLFAENRIAVSGRRVQIREKDADD